MQVLLFLVSAKKKIRQFSEEIEKPQNTIVILG